MTLSNDLWWVNGGFDDFLAVLLRIGYGFGTSSEDVAEVGAAAEGAAPGGAVEGFDGGEKNRNDDGPDILDLGCEQTDILLLFLLFYSPTVLFGG